MKITILGCGPSYGVPSLYRGFGKCDPTNVYNNRTRSSMLLNDNGNTILFDTGPEIRLQLLRAGCSHLDAVVYTHAHYDHMGGADDLRMLLGEKEQILPIYLSAHDNREFQDRLNYLIQMNVGASFFDIKVIRPYEPFDVNGIKIIPILQYHGDGLSMGYRIGDFAYSTDVKSMDEQGFEALKGVKTWVIGVVTPNPNNKHITLVEALEWIERIKPERAFITHMGTSMDYAELCKTLPPHIRPVYDGMVIDV